MKLSHFLIMLFFTAAMFACILFCNADIFIATRNVSDEYKNYLTTSAISAIESAEVDSSEVFKTEKSRDKTVTRFFDTLKLCFNIKGTYNESIQLENTIPCVALIDNDGMYVNYRTTFKNSADETEWTRVTSPLCSWGQQYGKYYMRFYLDNTIDVISTDNTKMEYKGNYHDVRILLLEDYTKRALSEDPEFRMSFLDSEDAFIIEKSRIIIAEVNKTINYYINQCNNTFINVNKINYEYIMPIVADTDYSRLLTGPTVISFMQGNQITRFPGYLNIYAIAGSEKTVGKSYTITTESINGSTYHFYHDINCSELDPNTDNKRTYSTMQECAKKGAYPCPNCIK